MTFCETGPMEAKHLSKNIGCLLLCWLVAMARCGQTEDPCPHTPRCNFWPKGKRLICSEGLHEQYGSGSSSNNKVRALTLCRWPNATFDPEVSLTLFPHLQKFTLINSNVTRLAGDFMENSRHLEVVNMSSLQLERVADSTFSRLDSVRVLDLRFNRLTQLDASTLADLPTLQRVFLAENPWNCSSDLTWLVDDVRNSTVAHRVVDRDKMLCSVAQFPGKPVLRVMELIKSLDKECPKEPPNNCTCWISHLTWHQGLVNVSLLPVINVDCSNLGLTQMPDKLPTNTTTLLLKGNQISDLQPLVNNDHYQKVKDIYLDNNKIQSIAVLEGASWLLNFQVLSLKGNQLSYLPTYALDNALEINPNAVGIFLGFNPWQCDCHFTPSFQELLLKYLKLVKDISDVKCSFVEGDKNSLLRVRDLSRNSVCREPSEYFIQPLDLLNGVLASLIVFVLGKLAYDYWAFKRTGKLPWIVSKMP